MTELEAKISCLRLAYEKLTGFSLAHRGVIDPRQNFWFQFIKAGFTVQDLELVILHIKNQIRLGERRLGALRFSNLIEDPLRFQEELGLAKAQQRNQKPPPSALDRVKALRERPVSQTTPADHRANCVSISEVIEAMRKAAQ